MTEKLDWTTRTIEERGIELPWQRVERYGPILDTNGEAFYAGDNHPPKGTVLESGTVFIPDSVLYGVAEQGDYDSLSPFGTALLLGTHEGYALEQAGLAVQETRGGYHGTEKLRQLLGMD